MSLLLRTHLRLQSLKPRLFSAAAQTADTEKKGVLPELEVNRYGYKALECYKRVGIRRNVNIAPEGKIVTFSVMIIAGNGAGIGSYGVGKAKTVAEASLKALRKAHEKVYFLPLFEDYTLLYPVAAKFQGARVVFRPAYEEKGLAASYNLLAILRMFGVPNAYGKRYGTKNPFVVTIAAFKALSVLRSIEEVAESRGMKYWALNRTWLTRPQYFRDFQISATRRMLEEAAGHDQRVREARKILKNMGVDEVTDDMFTPEWFQDLRNLKEGQTDKVERDALALLELGIDEFRSAKALQVLRRQNMEPSVLLEHVQDISDPERRRSLIFRLLERLGWDEGRVSTLQDSRLETAENLGLDLEDEGSVKKISEWLLADERNDMRGKYDRMRHEQGVEPYRPTTQEAFASPFLTQLPSEDGATPEWRVKRAPAERGVDRAIDEARSARQLQEQRVAQGEVAEDYLELWNDPEKDSELSEETMKKLDAFLRGEAREYGSVSSGETKRLTIKKPAISHSSGELVESTEDDSNFLGGDENWEDDGELVDVDPELLEEWEREFGDADK